MWRAFLNVANGEHKAIPKKDHQACAYFTLKGGAVFTAAMGVHEYAPLVAKTFLHLKKYLRFEGWDHIGHRDIPQIIARVSQYSFHTLVAIHDMPVSV